MSIRGVLLEVVGGKYLFVVFGLFTPYELCGVGWLSNMCY